MLRKMLIRYGVVVVMILSIVYLSWLLVSKLAETELDAGIAALLGALIGGVTVALTAAIKDLYGADDK